MTNGLYFALTDSVLAICGLGGALAVTGFAADRPSPEAAESLREAAGPLSDRSTSGGRTTQSGSDDGAQRQRLVRHAWRAGGFCLPRG